MAQTYWNPAVLLKISYKAHPDSIQCVGTTKKDTRCRWTVEHDDFVAALDLLANISEKNPDDVTVAELADLAELCLCRSTKQHPNCSHQSQMNSIVEEWEPKVQRARRDHTPATSSSGNTDSSDARTRRVTRERTPSTGGLIACDPAQWGAGTPPYRSSPATTQRPHYATESAALAPEDQLSQLLDRLTVSTALQAELKDKLQAREAELTSAIEECGSLRRERNHFRAEEARQRERAEQLERDNRRLTQEPEAVGIPPSSRLGRLRFGRRVS